MNLNQLLHLTTSVSNVLPFIKLFSNQSVLEPTVRYSQPNLRPRTLATLALVVIAVAVSQLLVTPAYGQTPDQPAEPSGTHQPPGEDPESRMDAAAEPLDGSGGELESTSQADTTSPTFVSAVTDSSGLHIIVTFSKEIHISPFVRYVSEVHNASYPT